MDPDQLIYQMPADLELHCFQKKIQDFEMKLYGCSVLINWNI